MICGDAVHSEWPIECVYGSILHIPTPVYRWLIQPFARLFFHVVQDLCHQQISTVNSMSVKKGESAIMIVRRWGSLERSNASENAY